MAAHPPMPAKVLAVRYVSGRCISSPFWRNPLANGITADLVRHAHQYWSNWLETHHSQTEAEVFVHFNARRETRSVVGCTVDRRSPSGVVECPAVADSGTVQANTSPGQLRHQNHVCSSPIHLRLGAQADAASCHAANHQAIFQDAVVGPGYFGRPATARTGAETVAGATDRRLKRPYKIHPACTR